jgi:hypothetical protein
MRSLQGDIDGGPFRRPPCVNVTLEGERESFSNRSAKRKILPENNVLSGCSACSFLRAGRRMKVRRDRGWGHPQPGIGWKSAGSGLSNPLKTGAGGFEGLKTSQNWTNQCNSISEIVVQIVGNPVF